MNSTKPFALATPKFSIINGRSMQVLFSGVSEQNVANLATDIAAHICMTVLVMADSDVDRNVLVRK